MASMASSKVFPLAVPALVSLVHPLYQGMLVLSSLLGSANAFKCRFDMTYSMLSPCHPEMGTKGTDLGL